MADSDKNILITPQTSQTTDPSIVFSSGATGGDDVTLFVTDDGTITTLSIEGSAGQLFSVSNDLTGVIFSVNDVSGIPSLEVNADGTISLAEFDGEVGIGTAAPTEMLHIEGRDVASSNTGILVQSRGDAFLSLIADTVSDSEANNPYITFSQDEAAVLANIGTVGAADVDAQGLTFTGAANNGLSIHHRYATGQINLGVNGQVGLTVDDNNRVYIGQDSIGYFTAVTGDYGSVQAVGAEGSAGTWHGFSIGGRSVFMDNAGSATTNRFGLYDDINNLWAIQYNTGALGNSELSLYYNGSVKMVTTNTGVSVTGTMAATTVTGALNAGDITTGTLPVLRGGTGVTTSTGTGNTVLSASPTFTGTVNMSTLNAGNIDSSGTITASSRFTTDSGDGKGLGFWGGAATTYGHYMSQAATQGRITGETTSDYNQYFEMNSGTNRGFVFETDGTKLFAINPDGVRSAGNIYPSGSTTKGIQASTGYGSINVIGGGTSSYLGYSINNDITFMSNGSTHGLYNGGSAEWIINSTDNSTTNLYAAGTARVQATTSGGNVVGALTATTRLACTSTTEYFDTQVYSTTGITSSGEFKDHSGTVRDVGFNHVRSISQTSSTINPLDDIHCGSIILRTGASNVSILMSTGTPFPVGSMCTILNDGTGGTHTISANTTTMHVMDGSGSISTPASFALAIGGCITVWRQNSTIYYVWGAGIP